MVAWFSNTSDVYVSIYESNSRDGTAEALEALDEALQARRREREGRKACGRKMKLCRPTRAGQDLGMMRTQLFTLHRSLPSS